MSNTSNQIKEAEQKVRAALDELIVIKATAMARDIIGEFTVKSGCLELDIEGLDFDNRIIEVQGGYHLEHTISNPKSKFLRQ